MSRPLPAGHKEWADQNQRETRASLAGTSLEKITPILGVVQPPSPSVRNIAIIDSIESGYTNEQVLFPHKTCCELL
jgi:hypothetical protein